MATQEDLEDAIAVVAWRREDLEVYADYLIEQGDPRGELITYDLSLGRDPRVPIDPAANVDPVRLDAIARWLGADIAKRAAWSVGYAFIGNDAHAVGDGDDVEYLTKLLDRGGPHVRDFGFRCERGPAEELLERLASSPRPSLVRLEIEIRGDVDTPLPPTLVSAIAAAAPALDELVVEARDQLLLSFPHPRLHTLRVAGWQAIGVVAGQPGPPMHIRELDLGFKADMDFDDEPDVPPAAWAAALPDVRCLDLSRNDELLLASGNWGRGGRTDAFRYLRASASAVRATHVRLPALRTKAQAADLVAALDAMPAAVDVELVRMYAEHAYVLERLAARMPPLRAPIVWTWPSDLPGTASLTFLVGSREFAVRPAALIGHLERSFDELPYDAREAWLRIWTVVGQLRAGATIEIGYDELRSALAPLRDELEPVWTQIRDALERTATTAIVVRGDDSWRLSGLFRGTP